MVASVASLMPTGVSEGEAATTRQPIEVDLIEPGVPQYWRGRFDRAFTNTIRSSRLTLLSTSGSRRKITNAFYLAPGQLDEPMRVTVRIRGTAMGIACGIGPCRTIRLWNIDTALPDSILPTPQHWIRMSLTVQEVGVGDPRDTGRGVALCVLEALNREAGLIRDDERIELGRGVTARKGRFQYAFPSSEKAIGE